MKGLTIVIVCLLASLAALPAADPPKPHAKPNIVILLADDMGYGDPGCYNPRSKIATPNIDRLAAEGPLFTTTRANGTVCSPSRAALLTGRYADRVGDLAATNKKLLNELSAALRRHIQRGGATPWQKPHVIQSP